MLTLTNNILSLNNEIVNSANYILNLYADKKDVDYFGVIILADGAEKVYKFVATQIENKYTIRLNIMEEDLNSLSNVKIKIVSVSNVLKQTSNTIELPLDINAIKQTIKISNSREISNLKLEFNELKTKINNILTGKVLESLNIINKEYIKKGMIPVADDFGNWIATYPFVNIVTSVNNQEAINGSIILDANMIQYTQEKTIYRALRDISEAITALNNSVLTLTNQQKELNNKLNDVILEQESYKNSGII